MAQTNINISIDDNLKRQFNSICNELGLNMSTAFTIFAKATVQQQRIPFEISLNMPNAETIVAIKESERISHDPNMKGYTDIDKMMEELLL